MIKKTTTYTAECKCGNKRTVESVSSFLEFVTICKSCGWIFNSNRYPLRPEDNIEIRCPECEAKRKAELCKSTNVRDRIAGGYYENDQKYNEFLDDALKSVGLADHPKASKAFSFAWEHGHASGYGDVLTWLEDVAELLK